MADQQVTSGDGNNVERRAPPSAWQDPRLWVSICGALLTIAIFISGLLLSRLSTLDTNIQVLTQTQIKTATQQTEEIKNLRDRLDETRAKLNTFETNQNAYNYNLNGSLTAIKTELQVRGSLGK